jgi:hypothetical protein
VTRRASTLSETKRLGLAWFNFQSARLAFAAACEENQSHTIYPHNLAACKTIGSPTSCSLINKATGARVGGSTSKALDLHLLTRRARGTNRALFTPQSRGLQNNWIPNFLFSRENPLPPSPPTPCAAAVMEFIASFPIFST